MISDYINILKGCRLFKGIEGEALNSLIFCLSPKVYSYSKDAIIINAGEEIIGVGVILSGKVHIVKETIQGDRIIMAKLSSGSIFAEVAAFANKSSSVATVIAQSDCKIIFLPPEKITGNCQRFCEGHRILIHNMITNLAEKAMLLNKKIEYLMIKSMRGKIAAYLMGIYKNTKRCEINLPYNRNELADYLGVSRPSMSRELGRMRDEGLIEFEGRKILLKNTEELFKIN